MITIISDIASPRLKYTLDFIFNEVYGIGYSLVCSTQKPVGCSIVYSNNSVKSGQDLTMDSCGILTSTTIDASFSAIIKREIVKYLDWEHDKTVPMPDLFGIVFFCLSRYEEYGNAAKDGHGRFVSMESILSELELIEKPIVDLILKSLTEKLFSKFGLVTARKRNYKFLSTLDIDQAWAFKYKGISNVFGLGKDLLTLEWARVWLRINVLVGHVEDPFDTFERIMDLHTVNELKPLFFILAAKHKSKHDRNHSIHKHDYNELLLKLVEDYEIGIHPSYRSNTDTSLLKAEIASLGNLINERIVSSRQHFLKLEIPTTYHNLLAVDILTDFTMGYANSVGYRAGTGHNFLWYDLVNESVTPLRIQPFQVMDGTLNTYQNLSPDAALAKVLAMIKLAKELDSPFCILWHNSSFHPTYGWEGWDRVYEEILKNGKLN